MELRGLNVLSRVYFVLAVMTFLHMPMLIIGGVAVGMTVVRPVFSGGVEVKTLMFGIMSLMIIAALAGAVLAYLQLRTGRLLAARQNLRFCRRTAWVSLLALPFGTAVGIYTLRYLQRPEVQAAFDAAPPVPATSLSPFRMDTGTTHFVSIIALVMSAVSLLFGLGAGVHTLLFLNKAVTATGTITRMDEHQGNKAQRLYTPVFTYIDPQGEEHEVISSHSSSPPAYAVGDRVPVLYDPRDPENAKIDSFISVWGLAFMPALFGIINAVVFGIVFWKTRKPALVA